MGVIAAALVGAAVTAGAGVYTNRKNQKANAAAQAASKGDYQARLNDAAGMAKQLQGEYEALLEERPDLSWESFVKNKIKAIDDPYLREVYANGKTADFEKLREFAKIASTDNMDALIEGADRLSGGPGKFAEITSKRDELVMNTDASSRFARAYELAAPVRNGATTVKYDSQGRLVEGQRADKQAFSIANEVNTAVEQEQKSDLRALEQDRITAAQSQTEKARGFLGFYDSVKFASDTEDDRYAAELGFQATDEQRVFDMYKMFAGGAAGITAVQPNYADPNAGNAMIAQGAKSAVDAVGSYYSKKNATTSSTSNPYKG